jgi:hypothetical protein
MVKKEIVVVSGLPRSGTSMMMAMLQAGGLAVLTDKIRRADKDNPKGYFELEKVKEIKKDKAWLKKAPGKVVKIISSLLKFLPKDHVYQIIFIERQIKEVLASQKQMMKRRKSKDNLSDQKMTKLFNNHLKEIKAWLEKQPNMKVLYISYNQTIKAPQITAKKVNQFLGGVLDENKMAATVDRKLYRQRKN